jgi:7-carboxy-7-deazaguanine synthase
MERVDDGEYYVSEIFRSLQGEGNYAGVNALFVRFQLCNLRCAWCDTKYTWTAHSDEYKSYSKEELSAIISEAPSKHIIFTGGEPALYRLDLLATDPSKKYHVETSGSIDPLQPYEKRLPDGTFVKREAMDESVIKRFNWVISPKLKHSKQWTDINSLKYWTEKEYAVFKFVIKEITDIDETDALCLEAPIEKDRVYLSLEGKTLESQIKPQMAEEIIARGYHFSPRLHVLLWDNQRLK